MANIVRIENVPRPATSAAGSEASDGAARLLEDDFARLRANVVPLALKLSK
jgi:hypothetical protein